MTSSVVFSNQSYTTRPRQSSSPINPTPLDLVSRLLRSILHYSTSSVVFSNQSFTHSTSSVVFSDQSYTTRPRQSSSPINPTPLDLVSSLLQSILYSLDLVSVFSDQSYTTQPRPCQSSSPINPTFTRHYESSLLESFLHSLDLVNKSSSSNPPLTRPRGSSS